MRHAVWMGEILPLDASPLAETEDQPEGPVVPDTNPGRGTS